MILYNQPFFEKCDEIKFRPDITRELYAYWIKLNKKLIPSKTLYAAPVPNLIQIHSVISKMKYSDVKTLSSLTAMRLFRACRAMDV
jgi:hypothetical protein